MIEIRLADLHAGQQVISEHAARFKVLICGRRFGKTTLAMDMLCERLLDGQSTAYFAPTYRMGSDVWREMKRILAPVIRESNEHEWRLELYTGGVFECWSLANSSAETVRGRKYHYVVIDEAALIPSADIWHSAIRPLLTDFEGGALFCSTPRGRNWLWTLYSQGQSAAFPEWQSWRQPTTANPHINPAEVEAARTGMPERFFKQEYEAVFLDDGGVVFRNVEGVCVLSPIPHANYPLPPFASVAHSLPATQGGERQEESAGGWDWYDEERCYFGVDWGKDNDFTCVSVMTKSGRQLWLERFNQIGWAVQRGRLADLYERFKPYVILAEENSAGSVNIEALQADGLPVEGFTTTGKSKGPLIENLALAMERSAVHLLNDDVLKHELMAYEMTRTKYGWSYGAPPGGHDDTVVATALSLWASQRYGRVIIEFA